MNLHELSLAYDPHDLAVQFEQLLHQEVTPQWFEQWSVLGNKINDLYVSTNWCFEINTADEVAKERYETFHKKELPKIQEIWNQLTLHATTFETTDPRYIRIVERLKVDVQTSSREAVALQTQENEQTSRYKVITSQQKINLGETKTLIQAKNILKTSQSRDERERIWTAIQNRQLEDAPEIQSIFFDLVKLRNEKAKTLGFTDYPAYIWQAKHRIDYTPCDSLQLLDYVSEVFADAQETLKTFKAKTLNTLELRPWDVDISFELAETRTLSEQEFLTVAHCVLESLSPAFAAVLESMMSKGHIDIMNRPNKTTVSYTTSLTRTDEPLVLINCTGNPDNLKAVFHELGHAIHHAHLGPGKLYFEKSGPKEVNEFFAYSIQTLGAQKLLELDLFTASEKRSYQLSMLCNVLEMFEYIDRVERFQHWAYRENDIANADVDGFYERLAHDPRINWSGYKHIQRKQWQSYSVLISPFYSIEYVISWLATLIFVQKLKHKPEMLTQFKQALSQGNTKTARETFVMLDINFPFSKNDVKIARESFEKLFLQSIL
jgi:oligoendopeptidase F